MMTDSVPSPTNLQTDPTRQEVSSSESGAPFSPVPAPPKQAPLEESLTKLFIGPNGIRAGWRLLIFVVIWGALVAAAVALATRGHRANPQLTALTTLRDEGVAALVTLLAMWIMAKIEARSIADYGLPAREAFRDKFCIGLLIGFGAITILLGSLRAAHVFYFGSVALQGTQVLKYAALWGLAFLCVGFFEETFFRGYVLFTLTTGMTFWPAAVVLSGLFGYIHHSNPGESWMGAFNAGLFGVLICLLIRRTGNLWLPIGFHAAWDWGETYFYGVADSGLVAPGHLFNSKLLLQPAWLSGGTVGPEGSWLCTILLALLFIVFAAALRQVKYPNEAAILDPRKKKAPPAPSILGIQESPTAQV